MLAPSPSSLRDWKGLNVRRDLSGCVERRPERLISSLLIFLFEEHAYLKSNDSIARVNRDYGSGNSAGHSAEQK